MPGSANGALVFLSLTSSMAPINPAPRVSPTSGWLGEAMQLFEEIDAHVRGVLDEVALLDDLQVLQRDRHGNGMPAAGEAMTECPDLGGVVRDSLIDLVGYQERGQAAHSMR